MPITNPFNITMGHNKPFYAVAVVCPLKAPLENQAKYFKDLGLSISFNGDWYDSIVSYQIQLLS